MPLPEDYDESNELHYLHVLLLLKGFCPEKLIHGVASIRREIADFVAANPEAEIAETPLRDWVLWDSNTSVARYADRMRTGSQWGGAIEMAVCARVRGVHVHVYEQGAGGFRRISCFDGGGGARRTVSVIYGGRCHYDGLDVG